MKVVRGLFCIALLGSVIPWNSLQAQGQRQTSDADVERLRIQAEERAREETEQQNWETRIFPVKYVDLGQLNNALSMFRAKMQISPELHVISVRAPKEIMPAIEDAIKRLDVPQPRKEAELTIYVIIASDQPEPSTAIPPVLVPVLNQLKAVLAYKSYRVLDTLITRGTNNSFGNQTSLNGTLALSDTLKPTFNFQARFQIENPDGKTPVLRLNDMSFRLGGGGMNPAGVSGNVEIPQGQQVVVGKATLGDKALILVMSAKLD